MISFTIRESEGNFELTLFNDEEDKHIMKVRKDTRIDCFRALEYYMDQLCAESETYSLTGAVLPTKLKGKMLCQD